MGRDGNFARSLNKSDFQPPALDLRHIDGQNKANRCLHRATRIDQRGRQTLCEIVDGTNSTSQRLFAMRVALGDEGGDIRRLPVRLQAVFRFQH